jgi:DNA invertase Pin-like site-specific DNA recombinase
VPRRPPRKVGAPGSPSRTDTSGEAEALLVLKLDRLTRSVVHLGQLVEEFFASDRCALLSVYDQIDTRSANGRMMINIPMSVAQWSASTSASASQSPCAG